MFLISIETKCTSTSVAALTCDAVVAAAIGANDGSLGQFSLDVAALTDGLPLGRGSGHYEEICLWYEEQLCV